MSVATVGSPQTIALGAADALIVSCSAVDAVASVAGSTGFIGAPYELGRVVGETGRRFGPYGRAVTLIVSSLSGSITAEVSQPSRVGDGADALSTQQGASSQALVSGARTPVAASRAITADDNGSMLTPTGSLTLTIPVGLSPMPSFTVDCPASGTVSVAVSGGATINGATTTLTRTRSGNPVGFVVLAHESDAYGVSGS